jgi:Insertion element 4 transposase N-terminal/Transposase DDE domain
VSKSAMPGAASTTAVAGVEGEVGGLRTAVLAGPGAAVRVDDGWLAGALGLLVDGDVIAAGLAREGHAEKSRRRVLTAAVTVAVIVGLCLFRRDNYDVVLARMMALLPGALAPGDGPPTGQALSAARGRLVGEPVRAVFERTAGVGEAGPGSYLFGLLVTAFDGTVVDLAATAEMGQEFATPSGGRYPQARIVTLVVCGTRRVVAAAMDSCALSEQALVDSLAGALRAGTLNLCDRNFFSMDRFIAFSAAGAHLAWRVKNGVRSLPATIIARLSDGSYLVRLRESDAMLARRRAKAADRSLPRLGQTIARLVEFTVTVTDGHGRARTSRFRILTTLTDHTCYPAEQIAAAYAERWQVELAYYNLKVTLRGAGTRLRGQTPKLARQEIWGLLIVYNALVDLAVRTAVNLDVDPDQISFTVVLAFTRAAVTAHRPCPGCGHRPSDLRDPHHALTAAIASQPLNRTGRHRTSPRTKTQRQTEHTRDVTYTITIVTSNLPKTE